MPQWPQYWKDTDKDLKDLDDLLEKLLRYGFIHEDILPNIDKVMSELQDKALRKYAKEVFEIENNQEDLREYEDFYIPQVNDLYKYTDEKDRPQFIQDLRNTIYHLIYADTYSIDGVSDEIRNQRDIDSYIKCTHD